MNLRPGSATRAATAPTRQSPATNSAPDGQAGQERVLHRRQQGRVGAGHRHRDGHGVGRGLAWPVASNALSPSRAPNTDENTEPITATPSVAPSSRVASFDGRPDAGPGRWEDQHDRLGRRGGDQAHAQAHQHHLGRRSWCRTTCRPRRCAIHAIAVPKHSRPVTTTARVPTRGASMPPTTEAIAIEIATGRIRAPVESGPKSRTTWKYCVIRKMKPDSAKKVIGDGAAGRAEPAVGEEPYVEHRVLGGALDHHEHARSGRRIRRSRAR